MTMPYQQPPIDPQTGQPIPPQPLPPQPPQYIPPAPTGLSVPVPPLPPPAIPTHFTKEQVEEMLNAERERVRQEEKNKLYPEIESQKEALRVLTEDRDQRLAAEQEAQRQAEEAQRQAELAQLTVAERIETQVHEQGQQWEQRFAQMQEERDREKALREKEAEFNGLNEYRNQRLLAEAENIAPQLQGFVRGNTQQEIDAAIEQAKVASQDIVQEFQSRTVGLQRQLAPPPTGAPGASTLDPMSPQPQTETYSAEQLRSMSMEEYAARRNEMLNATSQRVAQQGLYAP